MTPGGVNIQQLVFGQGGVEVTYVQEYETDPTTGIQEVRAIAVPAHLIPDAMDELLDSIDQVVKALHVARRQPAPTRER
jgi:hypothetical protein